MIFRKPQNIEYPVLLLSVGCLLYVLFSIDIELIDAQPFQMAMVRAGLLLVFVCLCGEMFLRKDIFRIGILLAHCVTLLATIAALRGRYIVGELMLVSVFILQSSLRLSLTRGLVLSTITIICVTLIGVNLEGDVSDRMVILLFGAFWASITAIIMYYRERLVEKSKVQNSCNRNELVFSPYIKNHPFDAQS